MKGSLQFWLLYAIGWLAYGGSLAAVFFGVGYRLEFDLLWMVVGNVLPVFCLGIGVIYICRKLLKWNERKQPQFLIVHLLLLVLFSLGWCFLTLLDLSLLNFIKRGVWNFVVWDSFGIQWQLFTGALAYVAVISSVYVKQINENLQEEERLNAELKMLAVRAEAARSAAELAVLRTQLNPHFLFNTLHSLMALVRSDSKLAEEAIERFALMLRYVLSSQDENRIFTTEVTFAEEWDFVQNYLDLERLRLGDRLKLTTEIESSALGVCLPAFSLQPIVENAVKYAIAPHAVGGHLHITARSLKDQIVITVCDDGDGNSLTDLKNGNRSRLGLRLVRESLAARFGTAANLKIENAPNEGFKVSLTIPRVNTSEVIKNALDTTH